MDDLIINIAVWHNLVSYLPKIAWNEKKEKIKELLTYIENSGEDIIFCLKFLELRHLFEN